MKKALIIGVFLLLLLGGGLMALPGLISTDGLLASIKIHVKAVSAQELNVVESKVSLLPWPGFVMSRVTVGEGSEAAPALFSADAVRVSFSLVPLIQGRISIASIDFDTPQLNLAPQESSPGASMQNWLDSLKKDAYFEALSSLTIKDGSALYQISKEGTVQDQWRGLKSIQADAGVSLLTGHIDGSAKGTWNEKPLSTTFSISPAQSGITAKADMSMEGLSMSYNGTLATSTDGLRLSGDFSGEVKDVWPWLHLSGATPTPVIWKSQLAMEPASLKIANIDLDAAGSKSKASLEFTWSPLLGGKGVWHFTMLDIDQIQSILENASMDQKAVTEAQQALLPVMPKDADLTLRLTADKVRYRKHDLTAFESELRLLGGEVNINRATAKFPGASEFTFLGLAKRRDGGATLEGSLEGTGQDLSAVLPMLPIAVERLPSKELKRFRMKGNIFLSDKQARLSEGQMLVEKTYFTGALVALLNQQPKRFEAVLRAQNLNLDPYLESYRAGAPKSNHASAGWEWLRNLGYELDLTAQFNDVVVQEMKGRRMEFTLLAKPGSLAISDLNAELEQSTVTGTVIIEPRDPRPWAKAALNFTRLPSSALLTVAAHDAGNPSAEPKTAERWSGEVIDFTRLKGWDGEFDLSFGTLMFPTFEMANVKFKAGLQNSVLNVADISSSIWQGSMRASGSIDVTDIPKIQSTFSLEGVDAGGLLKTAFDIENLSGTINASGQLGTSGLSPRSWVTSAKGGFGVAGRKINVKGFDLPRVARGMGAVRSVADIVNVARLAFQSGETEFNTLQGDIYVTNGVATTTDMKLAAELANGTLSGTLNMPGWKMDLNTLFTVQSGEEKEPPVLGVRFTGSLDDPQTTFDTSLLEAYIAKKSAQRLLQ